MSDPYAGLRDLIDQVPELLQPIIVGLAAMIPFVEGEGAAALGILAGIHPVVAGLSAAVGNILCVVLVVLLGARIRGAFVARRAARRSDRQLVAVGAGSIGSGLAAEPSATASTGHAVVETAAQDPIREPKPESKGRQRMKRWLVRFGVPGASLLAPLALPTPFTAAMLVASGVPKAWVILWQVIAIVLWTTLITLGATGLLAALTAI